MDPDPADRVSGRPLGSHPGPEVLDNHPDPEVSGNRPDPEVSGSPDRRAAHNPSVALRPLADNQLAAVGILTADNLDPAADSPDPAADNLGPAADSLGPAVVLPVAAADNRLGAGSLDPAADSPDPAVDNLDSAAGSPDPAVGTLRPAADSLAEAVLLWADNSVADSPVAALADNPEEATCVPAAELDIPSEVPDWSDTPVAAPRPAALDNQTPADNRAAEFDSPRTASANNPGVDRSAEHSPTARDDRISRPKDHLKDSGRIRWFCYRPL